MYSSNAMFSNAMAIVYGSVVDEYAIIVILFALIHKYNLQFIGVVLFCRNFQTLLKVTFIEKVKNA